ncbi:hypothetical protein M407DRAFT_26838 [Tulasnella calospora MUT 4182]|uniref:Ubiquitin-like domain-containing protein n=1 Tax=Tulasnella calospora MUT 4182 TaxID=1051891 RepID=A0A0C3KQM4_9AGAM|nr:hypothetical protein M407DRAFT_26838 [Tulasnella calospora MUT 4182]
MVRVFFPDINADRATFWATLKAAPDGTAADGVNVSKASWRRVINRITEIQVEDPSVGLEREQWVTVHINYPLSRKNPGGDVKTYKMNPEAPFDDLFQRFAGRYGLEGPGEFRFHYADRVLSSSDTPNSIGHPPQITLMIVALRAKVVVADPKASPVSYAQEVEEDPTFHPLSASKPGFIALEFTGMIDAHQGVFEVLPTEPLRSAVLGTFGLESDVEVWAGNKLVREDDTVLSLRLRSGDVLLAEPEGEGEECVVRKPVIYLFPPAMMKVKVQLGLPHRWAFNVLYPVVPTQRDKNSSTGERVEWEVEAEPNGTLVLNQAAAEVSYLFWEAKPQSATERPLERRLNFLEDGNECSPDDSVLLETNRVADYLDRSLKILGLHTEARTAFITFWLPCFVKHDYIALRFVPQPSYEKAAPLSIDPRPDVTTRVFMIFRGVPESDLSSWSEVVWRSREDPSFWADVVGVDRTKWNSDGLFRVLEWGGMEAPSSRYHSRRDL